VSSLGRNDNGLRILRRDDVVLAFKGENVAAFAHGELFFLIPVPVVRWFRLVLVVRNVQEFLWFVGRLDLEDAFAVGWPYPSGSADAISLAQGVEGCSDCAFDVKRHGGGDLNVRTDTLREAIKWFNIH